MEDKEEGAYWMDTYGDMVTLLLTFFVLLFAMSSLDKDKWEIFVKAFQSKFQTEDQVVIMIDPDAEEVGNEDVKPQGETPTVGNDADEMVIDDVKMFDDLYLYLKQYVEQNNMTDQITMSKGDGFTYISFDNSIFFEGDKADILPQSTQLLQVICDITSQIPEKIGEIHAHGHTAQENPNSPNNIPFDRRLAANRAANVIIYLQENSLVPGERLKDTGHGQNTPLVPHDGTEEARKKNRRCELVIAEEGTEPPSLNEIYAMLNNPENFADMDLPPIIKKEGENADTATPDTNTPTTSEAAPGTVPEADPNAPVTSPEGTPPPVEGTP